MSAREIVAGLKGHWHNSYGLARCPVHADRTPSLQIRDGDDGVVVHCFAGCDWQDVKDELRAMGLLPEFQPGQHAPRPRRLRPANTAPDPDKLAKIECAKEIWAAAQPATASHVETYLHGRGITTPIPPTIRFHPDLLHRATGVLFPTMVAGISGADQKLTGIQRTYLRLDGLVKAPVSDPKMTLGRLPGDAVRLGPAAEEIGICEGIETGLSAMQLYGGSVWCACGSHLDKIALPDTVKHVRIYADNGAAGERSAERAAQVFHRQGRRVTIVRPINLHGDFNDCLQAQVRRAA